MITKSMKQRECKPIEHVIKMVLVTFLLAISSIAFAQTGNKVTGTVTDQQGNPLVGVTIMKNGTQTGTVTDIDGNFSIDAPANGVLVVS